jgi:hypothetical protein
MKPNPDFLNEDKSFWAIVRSISEELGYTERGRDEIRVPTLDELVSGFDALGLDTTVVKQDDVATPLGDKLLRYFAHRAASIAAVKDQLNDAADAEQMFNEVKEQCPHVCNTPMNKQKGEKKTFAFLTGTVTMLLEEALERLTPLKMLTVPEPASLDEWLTKDELDILGAKTYVDKLIEDGQIRTERRGRSKVFHPADVQRLKPHCNYDPRTLTTVTRDGKPVRTLSRRVDGAYPSPVNPVAIWEIKEYYYTTTFGSRVADGIYETLLDGAELQDLRELGHPVKHYLFVDGYQTWWEDGKSYLCRIVDALHMLYVDEVLFGREIVGRVPELAAEWVAERRARAAAMAPKDVQAATKQSAEPV